MAFNLDFLLLRRPRLDYISPPICEVIFSSTGVVIGLESFFSSTVTGLVLGGRGGENLVWNTFPEAVCYNVYKESETPGVYDLVLECVPGPDIPFPDPPVGCYKVSAITPSGETDLSDPFCISPVLPTVLTLPEENVEMTTAVLNGAVNPMGFPASVFFQWGETLAYGNSTSVVPMGSGLSNVSFADVLDSLSPNTTYHYRAAATNGAVLVVGLDEEFTTDADGGGGIVCNDNGHGNERPFVNPAMFSWMNVCPLDGDSARPEWDGWLREKFFEFGTGEFCGYWTGGFGSYLPVPGKSAWISLFYNAPINRWEFALTGFDVVGNQATYWRGHGPVGSANDTGPFARFTACSSDFTLLSLDVVFGIPPPL